MAGKLIESHPAFPDASFPAFGEEFRFGARLDGSKPWHKNYGYGDIGLSLSWGMPGNNDILGHYLALIPELTFPLTENGRWSLTASTGLGLSWFSESYDQVSNPENIMVGSPFSFCALAALNICYDIDEKFSIIARPALFHSSNAHSNLPNVGMNLPMLGLGIRYRKPDGPLVPDTTVAYDDRIRFNTRLALAYNEHGGATGPADGPKYPIYLASFFLSKKLSMVNKVQAGIECWYNTGVYDYIISQDFYTENQQLKSMAVALMLGHEFLVGHFSLVTQGGVYLHNPFYRDRLDRADIQGMKARLKTWFPARIGIQYYFFDETARDGKNVFFGVYIKSNLGQADFLDTGIGFNF